MRKALVRKKKQHDKKLRGKVEALEAFFQYIKHFKFPKKKKMDLLPEVLLQDAEARLALAFKTEIAEEDNNEIPEEQKEGPLQLKEGISGFILP